MVYDWEGKEATCRRLYVDEKKSLDEVMEYFRPSGFQPSKRAFQTQFKRWAFPTKHSPAYKNEALVARIKELWEQNYEQRQMLETLAAEGFEISERELNRVRGRNRWLLRVPNKNNASTGQATAAVADVDAAATVTSPTEPPSEEASTHLSSLEHAIVNASTVNALPELTADMPAELKRKREDRKITLQAESDTRWASRKRRRRTRGWAGLPADPPQPPRFPSELTLDEGKALLQLDNKGYRSVRDSFEQICLASGIVKKTIAGPEKWARAKNELIEKHEALVRVFGQEGDVNAEKKATALDLLCMDVTKRLRTMDSRMTLAEAKNILGLDPDQSRDVRERFYQLLQQNYITSKLEAGDDTWAQLKAEWIETSPLLTSLGVAAMPPKPNQPSREGNQDLNQQETPEASQDLLTARRSRALEVLGRDVMKRLRDDRYKRDPTGSGRQKSTSGPGPGPAPPRMPSASSKRKPDVDGSLSNAGADHRSSSANRTSTTAGYAPDHGTSDLQIDPSLLLAAASNMPSRSEPEYDPSNIEVAGGAYAAMNIISAELGPGGSHSYGTLSGQGLASDSTAATAAAAMAASNTAANSSSNHGSGAAAADGSSGGGAGATLAAFFKLTAASPLRPTPDLWMGFVTSAATLAELYREANKPFEGRGMGVVRIEGVVRREESEEEVGFAIERDEELRSYLGHVLREMGGKAAFGVCVGRTYE